MKSHSLKAGRFYYADHCCWPEVADIWPAFLSGAHIPSLYVLVKRQWPAAIGPDDATG